MTATQLTVEMTAPAFVAELARVWGTKLGGAAQAAPAAGGADSGWVVTITAAGASSGQIVAWFQAKGAAAAIQAGLKLEVAPKDDAISALLIEVVTQSAQALLDKSALEKVTLSVATAGQGAAPAGATAFDLTVGGKACAVQVLVAIGLNAASALPNVAAATAAVNSGRRLEAVLDVDLPLVVRFGRATMPLRALAVLGPGSVIDMGRSPDEPVELLVGDRAIARGEVVIVGGNYGVRITVLTGSVLPEGELESRAS